MPDRALTAQAVLRTLDLTTDGPVRWGQPVRSRAPGVFVVEAPFAEALPQLDIVAIRAWLERVPTFTLDGTRPEPSAVADRLRSFWLPGQHVLYVGRSQKSLGARVGALYGTALGDRRPHSGGHWLKTLKNLAELRVWWAETDAPEEYEDALAAAIAETVTPEERAALRVHSVVLPWANLESATGEKRPTGLAGTLLDNEAPAPAKPATKPASGTASARASTKPAAPRTSATRSTTTRSTSASGTASRTAAKAAGKPQPAPTHVTQAGYDALKRELEDLTNVQRPEVIMRVKLARELGDLRENADYQAARNEQSFLEGRILALEQMLKHAQVIDADHTGEVILGSTVIVRVEGEDATLHIVGSTEADPANGKISTASPVGRALMGHRAGHKVEVVTPARTLHYEIVDVRVTEA
jgi:transcription elongation factor GreA